MSAVGLIGRQCFSRVLPSFPMRAEWPSGRAATRASPVLAALVLLGSAVAGCALIAGVPDVDLAPSIADSGARPPSDADDTLDEGTLDSGPRCRSEDAFERGVVEIGSLNVRGRCGSVHLTADENVAAVSSFVDGLSPSPESSWAVFTLTRSGAGTYGSQMQQMMAGSAALRDDGLALVVRRVVVE